MLEALEKHPPESLGKVVSVSSAFVAVHKIPKNNAKVVLAPSFRGLVCGCLAPSMLAGHRAEYHGGK